MRNKISNGFSLVEVLAAISIIGIVTFLAIPNIVRIKQDGEDNLARARAETLNMAIASYVQAVGTNAAATAWSGASDSARYTNCLARYISFAETNLTSFTPSGYSFTLPASIVPMTSKTSISNTSRAVEISY
jgi:prepilin-type N-terminal cleavage/methylation domain-containing protein